MASPRPYSLFIIGRFPPSRHQKIRHDGRTGGGKGGIVDFDVIARGRGTFGCQFAVDFPVLESHVGIVAKQIHNASSGGIKSGQMRRDHRQGSDFPRHGV